MTRKKAIYTINGKPSTLKLLRKEALEDSLRTALGDYISTREAGRVGISRATLQKWRNSGRLRAKKVKATWYYSREDLLELIKISK